jgi:DNA helicase-2/ATP-dependent DNA helicase PcrA
MVAAGLEALNPEQRLAVEHGVTAPGAHAAGPLLVIAGAGSGKTNTLAHRVAHLIAHGADPHRILMLTFSRRAAAEMTRMPRAGSRPGSNGRAPSTPSAPACCGSMPSASGSRRPSRSTTGRMPPTSST